MQTIKAQHDSEGVIVIFDTFYDSAKEEEYLIYYKTDGTIGTCKKNKVTILEKQI